MMSDQRSRSKALAKPKRAESPSISRIADSRSSAPFVHKLVLNRWVLSLFHIEKFEELAAHLRSEKLEGVDENNVHHFHHAISAQFSGLNELPTELLLEYDQNIFKYTQRLNERRVTRGDAPIVWKYFQYLMLLFTEIYLDHYFSDPDGLLAAINAQVATYNADRPDSDRIVAFDEKDEAWSQINKIAYWSATGSGKTLVMHANILQYQFYLDKYGRRRELNRIILLTPNEGLSQQHLEEFEVAGLAAELFRKDGAEAFGGPKIEIIDIHKLKEETGKKTIAIDSFEGNNLVLVDEGHRGASAGEEGAWMNFRNILCEGGFSFEYSATFGQAVKADEALADLYAKSILIDYSYRYFYGDGFGKDYQILNLDDRTQNKHIDTYLVACLLAFFQQQHLYQKQKLAFGPFNIDKPLWVFVGGRVTKKLASQDATDIIEILRFFSRYLADRTRSIKRIQDVLSHGLVTTDRKNIFAGMFTYLNSTRLSATEIYNETLVLLFNAAGGGALRVENLKGAPGEIALRVSDNEAFGVINVGDDSKLVKLCVQSGIATDEREFSGSLFHEINKPISTVNLLIGSKKFTEGWNSPRVSTMGLMNVGQSEGSQIIQLFGRGVRLRGYGVSLKRSSRIQLPENVKRPKDIGLAETLNIFGIRANYMAQFRDFLEEEGLSATGGRMEFLLPVIKNLGKQRLKTISLKKTINGMCTESIDAYRKLGPLPTLVKPEPSKDKGTEYLQKNQVILNWYPKIKVMKSVGVVGRDLEAAPNQANLTNGHIAFLDLDRLYFELVRFKAEREWYNLNLSQTDIAQLLADQTWYQLLIPADGLEFDSFEKVRMWEEIALALLKKYTARYYAFRKNEWEGPHLEYQDVTANDPNLLGAGASPGDPFYKILLDESQEQIKEKLEELKLAIMAGRLQTINFSGLKTVWFGQHLYQPLLYLDQKVVEITPVQLNEGEYQFVEDLKEFYDKRNGFFLDKELYLLRNLSRGRGVGFFENGNFHPDFILWLLLDGKQHVIFVDPKGIRNLPLKDPKIQFYADVRTIEQRLGDPNVHLHSFIISNTLSHVMEKQWGVSKKQMQERNILFQKEDKQFYIRELFEKSIAVA